MRQSWDYKADHETEPLPDEWIWERLRIRRDYLLMESDFRVLPDSPFDRDKWTQYRQALRDLPQNTDDPRQAVWPEKPTV